MDFADEPFEIEITDSLDLHAFSPKDVKAVTIAYLEEARKKGFRVVRLIHGKGVGVQRNIVRSVLDKHPAVLSYRDAPAEAGGWGATLATLRQDR